MGINDAIFEARSLFHLGFNILFYLQPFHGKKRVTFPYVSGLHFFFGGSFVNECYAHSVFDCRIFLDHLDGKGVTEVGVTGVSLGGLASGLLAAVEPRLQFSVPRMPMVNLADNLIRGSNRYHEPRIHFAANCASIGCPALLTEAFEADKLESQLDKATRVFLRDRNRNRLKDSDYF